MNLPLNHLPKVIPYLDDIEMILIRGSSRFYRPLEIYWGTSALQWGPTSKIRRKEVRKEGRQDLIRNFMKKVSLSKNPHLFRKLALEINWYLSEWLACLFQLNLAQFSSIHLNSAQFSSIKLNWAQLSSTQLKSFLYSTAGSQVKIIELLCLHSSWK